MAASVCQLSGGVPLSGISVWTNAEKLRTDHFTFYHWRTDFFLYCCFRVFQNQMERTRQNLCSGHPYHDHSNRNRSDSTLSHLYKVWAAWHLVSDHCPVLFCKTFLYFYDSAKYDGHPKWNGWISNDRWLQRMAKIFLRHSSTGQTGSSGCHNLSMQDQWNNYLEPLIYINSNSKQTISVGLSFFSGMNSTEWNLVFAAAVIVAMPILIVFVFFQKYFIQGVVVSGVKG